MEKIVYQPKGVCSRKIEIEVDGDIIRQVRFIGGCAGNTQGVARLLAGMTIEEAIARLEGIECGVKGTSCPDQLAQALISLVKKRRQQEGR